VDSWVVGYDGARNVRDEERIVVADTEHPPADDQGHLGKSRVVPRWVFITALAIFAGVVIVIIYGYMVRPRWIGVSDKKFWDYLELLFVPAALALGVYWLNRRQDERDQQAEEERSRRESKAQAEQQERALEVADLRAQDAALQSYLDQLTLLLVTKGVDELTRMQVNDDVRQVIQARSEPLLRSLNPTRRWSLVLFLAVMGLLTKARPLVSLVGADLRGVDGHGAPLQGVDLQGADLREANLFGADLSETNLREANLSGADMSETNLRGAILSGANLTETYLTGADLSRIDLTEADLSGAYLSQANLSEAVFIGANLSNALLSYANLFNARLELARLSGVDMYEAILSGAYLVMAQGITNEELERQAKSLEGATMPNDQKYEDWLKSKGRTEDGEKNSSPS
jgi:uncharacterized protein YjbI with pentapeptide repeats